MGIEYYAVCRETKRAVRCGRFYEWDGIDRREHGDAFTSTPEEGQVAVGYHYMFELVQFLRENEGKFIEFHRDADLFDVLQFESPDLKGLVDAIVDRPSDWVVSN